jgi:glycerol-3-phosphate O-acyltransferase / dihydroxyacetone phosphate acyltransferase
MLYRFLAWFLQTITRVFFRQIEVVGLEHVPTTGPVLFAGNHPNSLIDPILIITTCGRKVHFAAKEQLFSGWLMRRLLRGLGAIPIKRRDDHDGSPKQASTGAHVDNDAAFDAMFGVLGDGGAIGIFPEGLSHDEAHLSRLKTGAARLAIGAAHRTHTPITIVPCGLTFIHPKRFRSRVLVQYGPALTITDAVESSPEQVRVVTDEIGAALRRLTVNAPDWDTVRALDVVRRLYQPQEISIEERVELSRRFNTYYAQVAADPRVVTLMRRVRNYQDSLDELGITDRELAQDLSKLAVSARILRHLTLVAFWLPLAVPAAPLHVPPLAFARFASDRLTPRKDVVATTKLLLGLLLVLLGYAVAIALVGWKINLGTAIGLAILLPISGWATLRVLDRLRLVRRGFGVLFRRLAFRREVLALRGEREQLVANVVATVTAVKPAEVDAMFPVDHPDRVEESSKARRNADLDSELDKDVVE